jgi:hypothetical protein
MSTHCRSCRARISFARLRSGRTLPIDWEPAANGTVWFDIEQDQWLLITRDQPAPTGAATYLPHFATCPDADTWRTRKRSS